MKRALPLLLALLLLAACGTAPAAEQVFPPESEPGIPDAPSPTPHEGPDEDELPILTGEENAAPVEDEGESPSPAVPSRAVTVTLDGVSSYLRVTLPEGWTWEQAAGAVDDTVYALYPEDDPEFKVELHLWNDGFPGLCGTGMSFSEYTLADGRKASIAYEVSGEEIWWWLILPESPDAFSIQFGVPYALYEAHRAELEQMLGTIQLGVLASLDGPDVVETEEATG